MDTKTTEKTATAKTDEVAEDATTEAADTTPDAGTPAAADADLPDEPDAQDDDAQDEEQDDEEAASPEATGIGAGAAAVVSAALSAVALTGTWTGKVVAERETLVGQIKTSGSGTPAQQISEIYGDAWHSTALVNGVFALLALIVAALVLTLPRRPAWVRAVAVAGAVLGGLGLLLSVGTYFDLFLSLPTAGS
ncbi:hypothetical protein ACWD5B_23555 [Streptomyces tanashiensis]|uniref:hypothetical protein n=1 Tax=Streptomyces tanashiensis TaxID=67367 RepID=UPI00167669F2|nr:hypothetical protein [Streptomyces tanashiensis]